MPAKKGQQKPHGKAKKGVSAVKTKSSVLRKTKHSPSRGTILLASTALRRFLETVAILLTCGTIAVYILYYFEKQKVTILNQAVADIREYLQELNESNANKNDQDILAEAVQQSNILVARHKRNADMSRAIKKVMKLMNEGWKSFQGHLYYFNIQGNKLKHLHAKENCENQNAILVVITSDEEEEFIVQNVKHMDRDMWIGVEQVGNTWTFVTGGKPIKFYWGRQPTKPFGTERECAEIKRLCKDRLNCWFKEKCFELRNWICEMEPDPELIY